MTNSVTSQETAEKSKFIVVPPPPPPPTVIDDSRIYTALAGNVLEYYDFAIYGYFADIIGDVFFPPGSTETQLMESYIVFGAAFFARPFGGLLLGWIGDKYGRKFAMEQSVIMMAIPTYLMGCLPTYDMIGDTAYILLILVRVFQGLSLGGQATSTLVFALEGKPQAEWGKYAAKVYSSMAIGTMIGSLVGATIRSVLPDEALMVWGWRAPYYCGIFVALVGLYLRYYCPDHTQHLATSQNPFIETFSSDNRRRLYAAILVPMMGGAGFYVTFVWLPVFMEDLLDPAIPYAFWINVTSLFLTAFVFLPSAGWLADQHGTVPVMKCGAVLFCLIAPVSLYLIGSLNDAMVSLYCEIAMAFAFSLFGSPLLAWLVELFPPSVRLTSISLGFNIAYAFGGGLGPAISTALVVDVSNVSAGFFLSLTAIISLIGLYCVMPERVGLSGYHNNNSNNNNAYSVTTASDKAASRPHSIDGNGQDAKSLLSEIDEQQHPIT